MGARTDLREVTRGTKVATRLVIMAAVLCLVLLPLMAALGFMFGVVRGELSVSTVMGFVAFLMLGAFMFFGIFGMSRGWDKEKPAD